MSTEAILSVLREMEDGLFSVELHGRLLSHVASTRYPVDAECLQVIAHPLEDVGKQLREQFRRAFEAAGGEA